MKTAKLQLLCRVTDQSIGFVLLVSTRYIIMPSSVFLEDGSILTVLRRGRGTDESGWLETLKSEDLGKSWRLISRPVENPGIGGNPGSLSLLPDGRLAIVYGSRNRPYAIRMKISSDGGPSWSNEEIVGEPAPLSDIGYPRTVVLNDGSLLAVYYTNEGEERFIVASRIEIPDVVR